MEKTIMSRISDFFISPAYAHDRGEGGGSRSRSSGGDVVVCPPGRTVTVDLSYDKWYLNRANRRLPECQRVLNERLQGDPTQSLCKPYVAHYLRQCNHSLDNGPTFFGRTMAPDYQELIDNVRHYPSLYESYGFFSVTENKSSEPGSQFLISALALISDLLITPAYAEDRISSSGFNRSTQCPDNNDYVYSAEASGLIREKNVMTAAVDDCFKQLAELGPSDHCRQDLQHMKKTCQSYADDCLALPFFGLDLCIWRTRSVEITDFFKEGWDRFKVWKNVASEHGAKGVNEDPTKAGGTDSKIVWTIRSS